MRDSDERKAQVDGASVTEVLAAERLAANTPMVPLWPSLTMVLVATLEKAEAVAREKRKQP
jgi:hypothetical protein